MKVYIATGCRSNLVYVYKKKPKVWETWGGYYRMRGRVVVCRSIMRELLKGTSIQLPKHDSKQVVCVKLTAKKEAVCNG